MNLRPSSGNRNYGIFRRATARKLIGGLFATLLVLGGLEYFGSRNLEGLIDDTTDVARTQEQITLLNSALSDIKDVHTSTRAYIHSGDPKSLEPYHAALPKIREQLIQLEDLPEDRAARETLRTRVAEHLELASDHLETFRKAGYDAAHEEIRKGVSEQKLQEISALGEAIETSQRELLERKIEEAKTSAATTARLAAISFAATILVIGIGFRFLYRESRRRVAGDRSLRRSQIELQRSLEDLRRLANESALVAAMTDTLQTCRTTEEAYAIIARYIPRLLSGVSGAIGIVNDSRTLVETTIAWGKTTVFDAVFQPDDCWGLRRGRMHVVSDNQGCEPLCGHVHIVANGALCVPMIANGDNLGLICLESACVGGFNQAEQVLAKTIGEQASLALANLRLQDALRAQSIRDPLTSLFNRRYFQATLERELLRANRQGQPVAVMMIDVDHFKSFNDSHGHDGGDALLTSFGTLLRASVRGDDVPCRYGGEEFSLILPGASEEIALQRAEALRKAVKELIVAHQRRSLGPITISVGVAVYPTHEQTSDGIVRAADRALYQAKKRGRDRVVAANVDEAFEETRTNDEHNLMRPHPR